LIATGLPRGYVMHSFSPSHVPSIEVFSNSATSTRFGPYIRTWKDSSPFGIISGRPLNTIVEFA
jgi:hypothetical protein